MDDRTAKNIGRLFISLTHALPEDRRQLGAYPKVMEDDAELEGEDA